MDRLLHVCPCPNTPIAHIVLSSVIVATYTFLIAVELWRERRKSLIRRWPALFVPMLHGAIFLFPVALASLGVRSLATGWVAVFAIEVVLYVVGAAFIMLVLAKDRAVNRYKMAAEDRSVDVLLNRRGFFAAAAMLLTGSKTGKTPVSMLAFDLDHFKSINDQFGHKSGDAMLDLFARVARKTMRTDDVIGRIGGEEFIAIISGTLDEARIAAERVRPAFEKAAVAPGSPEIPATVSIGIACGLPHVSIDVLIARADAALYRAKQNGRNRVELDDELISAAEDRLVDCRAQMKLAATLPFRRLQFLFWCGDAAVARRNERNKEKGAEAPFSLHRLMQCREDTHARTLRRVVHFELDRMRGVLEANDLGHLQIDVRVDEVVVEHAAGFKEAAVLIELFKRLAKRAANRRDFFQLLRRQIVKVLIDGFARIQLVLDAIETGHQHRREREIRIGKRIGETHFDALGFRIGRVWDAA